MTVKVVVVGQGYVGLPLALAAAESGYQVIGFDTDSARVAGLSAGQSPIGDISDTYLASQSIYYRASSNLADVADADVVIFCLPTPLDESHKPDNSILLNGAKKIAPVISPKALIINESTVSPGFTRDLLAPIFPGNEIAYSPERIDPANKNWNVKNTPKLVAGLTDSARARAVDFYSKFISSVTSYSSIEVVETAKLLENSFRLVNISFINEIADFCSKMKIDVREVIAAASTKPYGFMPFFPSSGVGGHCIPVDPSYLAAKAKEIGASTRFIDLANEINLSRPSYFVGVATGMLGTLASKKVVVIGVAYKPDVADVRETPADALISLLRSAGADVVWHDHLVGQWKGEASAALTAGYDLAILVNPHSGTDLDALGSIPVLDTRGGY
jgi:UDP-N-acetyl-D-glucosamine dehydrogenase